MDTIQQTEIVDCLRHAIDDLESVEVSHPVLLERLKRYKGILKIIDEKGL